MPSRRMDARIVAALAVCGISFAASGCARHKVQAAAPVAAIPAPSPEAERPMNTAPDTTAAPPAETVTPPPVAPSDTSAPPPVLPPRPKPLPKPAKPPSETAAESGSEQAPARPPAPQISPQLSPDDQAAYQRRTSDDIAAAEKNLQSADGKQLSAAQQDLVEKIRSFVSQSRDASKGGDLTRAQNLAQKARLLSVELVNSL